jgi:hypothetical protein
LKPQIENERLALMLRIEKIDAALLCHKLAVEKPVDDEVEGDVHDSTDTAHEEAATHSAAHDAESPQFEHDNVTPELLRWPSKVPVPRLMDDAELEDCLAERAQSEVCI